MSESRAAIVTKSTRAALTRNPVMRFDGRSADGRRLRDLFRSYMRQLGEPNDAGTVALALAAAEAVMIAERARLDYRNGRADLDAVSKTEAMAEVALRRLGLNRPAPPPAREDLGAMMLRLAEEARPEARATECGDAATDSNERTSELRSPAEAVK